MRSYKEILSFLIIREQLSLGWKIAFFVVCGALLYGSLTIRQMSLRSMDVGGTVLASSNHVTGEASPVFLTVRLESGETVQASVNGKIDYRPGRRAILIETTAIFSASGNMSSKNISMSPPGNHLEERISFHVVD